MKTYMGRVTDNDWQVYVVDDQVQFDWSTKRPDRLNPRNDLRNHSPDGFAWGYNGSGPAQLALAILAFQFDDKFALKYYQPFKAECIAGLDMDEHFTLTEEDVKTFLGDILTRRIDNILHKWDAITDSEAST